MNVPIAHLAAPSPNQLSPFDRWDVGEDLFMSEDQEHELLDRDLRPFVEECDQMQGFQVITGADNAWAGFANKYLDGLRDEFGRKSVWVWGLEEARHAGRVRNTNCNFSSRFTTNHSALARKNVFSSSSTPRGLFRLSLLKPRFIFLSPTFHQVSRLHI
jgi:hypothetical protein